MKQKEITQMNKMACKHGATITTLLLGVLLHIDHLTFINPNISEFAERTCFSCAYLGLLIAGRETEKQGVHGLIELSIGGFQLYFLSIAFLLLKLESIWLSIAAFISTALFLFAAACGLVKLLISIHHLSNRKEQKLERVITIIVSILTVLISLFTGK